MRNSSRPRCQVWGSSQTGSSSRQTIGSYTRDSRGLRPCSLLQPQRRSSRFRRPYGKLCCRNDRVAPLSAALLHLSKRRTEIAGHVETAAQPGIAEARGELDASAAKDEEGH